MALVQFNINYKTKVGENLYLNIQEKNNLWRDIAMIHSQNGFWQVETDIDAKSVQYRFAVKEPSGNIITKELNDHYLQLDSDRPRYRVLDSWIQPNFPENILDNKILKETISHKKWTKLRPKKNETHRFSILVPLYESNLSVVLLGNCAKLGNWEVANAIELKQTGLLKWEVSIDLSSVSERLQYKYALLDKKTGEISFEKGDNRLALPNQKGDPLFVYHDENYRFQANELWKSAGVAVPVFSLRSENSFGVGEFLDLKLLADWAESINLSILQILPINDTSATHTWIDSYPYSTISVYALHPQYLSLNKLSYPLPAKTKRYFEEKRTKLNALPQIDYEAVMTEKRKILFDVFKVQKKKILKDKSFEKFKKTNQHWLLAYSVFCTLRDKYETADYTKWNALSEYKAATVERYARPSHREYENVMFHAWIQYELHLQLQQAVRHAHSKKIFIKGDLPIGIYRNSVEAWTEPQLFDLNFQAGAPPDFYSTVGQNWEFPTYNWEGMRKDGYQWWKNRFTALAQYFDAMRIDHILGFFRIWRIPYTATQAILGYFHPAEALTEQEFQQRGAWFDRERFTKPFINDAILWHIFGEDKKEIIELFLVESHGLYYFTEEFNTQRKIENYFKQNNLDEKRKLQLQSLLANVLFVEEARAESIVYHPRFNMHESMSYQFLSAPLKEILYQIYVDYFFKRQENLWRKSGMEKLPMLIKATDMLICAEDLGFVPNCVPEVMEKLGIVGLKLQRAPKENIPFFNPKNADYMNVVTYSSHDSTTLRQWWHENPTLTQEYYNDQLEQDGTAPTELSAELVEIVMKQHLYNNAMLAIFPIQEYFATDEQLRNPDAQSERINDPAEFPHYWRYRMHLTLEDLLTQKGFNGKIAEWVEDSGRLMK